ncbi:PssD/Cps14F family polysaccharide biosynthesis glycosyltransferase [Vibrio furnissii]|uniref:PssD/Cps14F family polysaccharide biosynthesis glycosyltransferase n=1 Tax=Vibrio furnissii TaxID=29494 RepID=UPI003753DF4B
MKNVLMCFGNGGHRAQANRIQKKLRDRYDDINYFSITDRGDAPGWSINHLSIGEVRDKDNGKYISPLNLIKKILQVYKFIRNNNITSVISTGPGISLIVYLASLFLVKKFIHIETWSKFEGITLTTKFLYFLQCEVLYQNEELEIYLPKGKFVGRL